MRGAIYCGTCVTADIQTTTHRETERESARREHVREARRACYLCFLYYLNLRKTLIDNSNNYQLAQLASDTCINQYSFRGSKSQGKTGMKVNVIYSLYYEKGIIEVDKKTKGY